MTDPERTRRPIAWVDGRVIPAGDATVPLMDDGFLRGDAVFDAVLVRHGRTHALDDHLARLRRSGKAMGIRIPPLHGVVRDMLAAWGEADGALKVVITRGGAVRGICYAPAWPATISLSLVDMPWRSALTGVKTVSYAANQWAQRQAAEAHADDALIVTDDTLMELPTGAICLVLDGTICSPDPDRVPVLDSVTVRRLDDVVGVDRRVLTTEDLERAEEAFVCSATRPVLPVAAVDDREFPAPGPRTVDAHDRLDTHITDTLDPRP